MFSKRTVEPIQEQPTTIWTCSQADCTCWMRDNFAFEQQPVCPLCHAAMVPGTKILPIIVNHSKKEPDEPDR